MAETRLSRELDKSIEDAIAQVTFEFADRCEANAWKLTPQCSSLSVQIRQREPSAKFFTEDLSIDEFASFDTACLTYVATITKRSQSKGTSPPFLEFEAIL